MASPGGAYYSIELYFDPALENQVLKTWNALARRQISTQLIDIESRPHLTLLTSPSLDPAKLLLPLKSFAAKHEPIPLAFAAVGALAGDLFLSPTPTSALLLLHAQLCELLRKEGVEAPEEFRPDSWFPNCAVAEGVPRGRMAEAFSVLRDLKLPVGGYAMDIGLVEYSPARERFSFPFGSVVDG